MRQHTYAIHGHRVSLVRDGQVAESASPVTIRNGAEAEQALRGFFPADDERERFGIAILNVRHRVTGFVTVSIGCLTSSLVHPREVFRAALLAPQCTGIILIHNHPSGDPEPSAEDLALTRRLAAGGALLGVEVLDHVILGEPGRYVSFKERGLV